MDMGENNSEIPRNTTDSRTDNAEVRAEYVAALGRSMNRPWATYGLVAVNVLIFVLMCVADAGSFTYPQHETLIRFGGDFSPLTIDEGESWRIVTSAFVHIGLFHLFCNLYALYGFGNLVERIFGHTLFFLIYFGSILTGGLLSLAMYREPIISCGASGAVFGVWGALAAYLLRRRSEIPAPIFKMLIGELKSLAPGALLLLLILWVNNWAHLGGALGGFLFGLASAPPVCSPRRSRILFRNAVVLIILIPLITVPFWFLVQNAKSSPFRAFVQQYCEFENQLLEDRQTFMNGRDVETITDEEYLKYLEERLLPNVLAMERLLEEFPKGRLYSFEKKELERFKFFIAKRLEIVRLEIQGIREGDSAIQQKALDSLREFEEATKSFQGEFGSRAED